MLTLKRITMKNIQSHKECVLELPPTGLICLVGDNSNGKSVVVKVTKALVTGTITKPINRAALVNRNAYYGEVLYERTDGMKLLLHLAREASATYVTLTRPGEEPMQRYLADKSWKSFVKEFGFHCAPDSNISLNISEADAALLFFKTPYKSNYEIMAPVLYDTRANTALENLETFLKDLRIQREKSVALLQASYTVLNSLKICDVEKEEITRNKLQEYYQVLKSIYIPQIPKISAVPKVNFIDLFIPKIPKIIYPKIYDIHVPSIPDITETAREISDLKENRCPTCGRRFYDAGTCSICV